MINRSDRLEIGSDFFRKSVAEKKFKILAFAGEKYIAAVEPFTLFGGFFGKAVTLVHFPAEGKHVLAFVRFQRFGKALVVL